ncbi:hypothetical protein L227DRAFT_571223 [Lentinus tigrinus ALCF2SS1-6]|uniref:Uncharacterized protein n=1 Tax=Lentinus tigrinus ALCF2SS1-6 TaxID=1328759 RepID=A0A5C2SU16_9APHY|nr:hypothetical protein L227DRAFT_571223 [Lentinus tigrinus ALCF2SS1-6]
MGRMGNLSRESASLYAFCDQSSQSLGLGIGCVLCAAEHTVGHPRTDTYYCAPKVFPRDGVTIQSTYTGSIATDQ